MEQGLEQKAFVLDVVSRRLWDRGSSIDLTNKECKLLERLATQPGRTVQRWALMADLGLMGGRSLDVQVHRLRRKLNRLGLDALQTVRKVGYRLDRTLVHRPL